MDHGHQQAGCQADVLTCGPVARDLCLVFPCFTISQFKCIVNSTDMFHLLNSVISVADQTVILSGDEMK